MEFNGSYFGASFIYFFTTYYEGFFGSQQQKQAFKYFFIFSERLKFYYFSYFSSYKRYFCYFVKQQGHFEKQHLKYI